MSKKLVIKTPITNESEDYLLNLPNKSDGEEYTIAVDEDVVHRGSASGPVNNEDIYGQKTFKHYLIADNDVYVHNNKHIYFHGTDSLNSTWLSQDSSTGTLRFYLPQYSAETSNCEIHLPRKSGIIATTDDIKDSIVNNIAPEYSAAGFYVKGSKVIYGGQLYVCTATNGADHEAWDSSKWAVCKVSEKFLDTDLGGTVTGSLYLNSTLLANSDIYSYGKIYLSDGGGTNYIDRDSTNHTLKFVLGQYSAESSNCTLLLPRKDGTLAIDSEFVHKGSSSDSVAESVYGSKTFWSPIIFAGAGLSNIGSLGYDGSGNIKLYANGPSLLIDSAGGGTISIGNSSNSRLSLNQVGASSRPVSAYTFTDKYKATESSTIYTSTYTFPTKQVDGSYVIATTEDIPTNYVTTDTPQAITASKYFTDPSMPTGFVNPAAPLASVDGLAINENGIAVTGKDADNNRIHLSYALPHYSSGAQSGIKAFTLASTDDLTGFITGPATNTDNAIAVFNGTNSKTIKNSALTIVDSAITSSTGKLDLSSALTFSNLSGSGLQIASNGDVRPTADNSISLGSWHGQDPTNKRRWKNLYLSGNLSDGTNSTTIANINNNFAPTYNTFSTYAVGQKVIHDGQLYECSTSVNYGEAWDSAKWTAINISSKFVDLDTAQEITRTKTFKGSNIIFTNSTYTTAPVTLSSNKNSELDISSASYGISLCVHDSVGYVDKQSEGQSYPDHAWLYTTANASGILLHTNYGPGAGTIYESYLKLPANKGTPSAYATLATTDDIPNVSQNLASSVLATISAGDWALLKTNHTHTISNLTISGLNNDYEFVNIKLNINSINQYVKLVKNTTGKYSGLFFIEETVSGTDLLYEISAYYNVATSKMVFRCASVY